jgi:bifunctional polynucleotide phosphatase/kinase
MSFELFPGSFASANKIALFDVDGTLICSKSGRRWSVSAEDTVFLGTPGHVHDVLDWYRKEGWIVALVTNQSTWDEACKGKIAWILDSLEDWNGWRPWCLVATSPRKAKDTLYRKPGRGMFDALLHAIGKSRDEVEVMMVGDAVGPEDPFPPYRWASSDKEFAEGIGATFYRPNEIFGCSKPEDIQVRTDTRELVILMGNPGSGKSTTGRSFVTKGYKHVEQDTLKNKVETLRVVKSFIGSSSVVVDATHASAENREPYLALAKEHGIPCRILWHIRDGRPFNVLRDKPVPEVAYAMYTKYFNEPQAQYFVVEQC